MAPDPVTLQVFQQRLIGIVREMRAAMIHSAFSPTITELYDLSCALLGPRGELVVQSEDNPQHIFPLLWSAAEIMRRHGGDLARDDVFLHNDPYEGGTHLNDIAVIVPYFAEDGTLLCMPVVRAHWEDVGGASHGSISGRNTEIFQEGLRIPLTRLRRGSPEFAAFLRMMLANMRVPHEREGDFNAMLGTVVMACERLDATVARYGAGAFGRLVDTLLDQEERRMRARLSALSPGRYAAENFLDPRPDLGAGPCVRVTATVGDGTITLDFAGSSPQAASPFNIGPSGAPTGAFMIVKALLDPDGPVNSGSFRPIQVEAPPGTFINATYPAAVGAMGDVRRNIEAAIVAALAPLLPERVTGDTKGTSNQLFISGVSAGSNRPWLLYEAPAGGTGGFAGGDGNNTLRTFAEGDFTAVQPVEAVEQKFPLLVRACTLRPDSGGAGRWRGGLGMRREIGIRTPGQLASVSDRNVMPPFGVFGGVAGAQNAVTVRRSGLAMQPSQAPGKVAGFALQAGDLVVFESSGGGGYGDPLDRDPAAVLADVALGYISADAARTLYGVDPDDPAGAAALRTALRAARHRCEVVIRDTQASPLGLPAFAAHGAQAAPGDIVELLREAAPAAPLRGVLCAPPPDLPHGAVAVPPATASFNGLREGERMLLRPIPVQVPALLAPP